MTTITTRAGHVNIHCYYDDQDRDNRGWYAEYFIYRTGDREPIDTTDSMKVWHPEMPRRADAEAKANRIARGYARHILAAATKG